MSTDFIRVENAEMVFETKKGRFHALREIDLSIAQGEFVALIGHSGCGKSTLLNLIAGILDPDEGTVRVAGRTVVDTAVRVNRSVILSASLWRWPPPLCCWPRSCCRPSSRRGNAATPLPLGSRRASAPCSSPTSMPTASTAWAGR